MGQCLGIKLCTGISFNKRDTEEDDDYEEIIYKTPRLGDSQLNSTNFRSLNTLCTFSHEKLERLGINKPYFSIPIILIEDSHYKSLLDFINIENGGIFYERKTKYENEIKNYFDDYSECEQILEKLLFKRSEIIENIKPFNEDDNFLLAQTYNEFDININPILIKLEYFAIFGQDINRQMQIWIKKFFIIIENYIEIKLKKKSLYYYSEKDNVFLFITDPSKKNQNLKFTDWVNDTALNVQNEIWNIFFFDKEKSIDSLYEEFDFIQTEIKCNLLTSNCFEYLNLLIESIKNQNEKKYGNEIKIYFTLLLKGSSSKEILDYLIANNCLNYFNKILIISNEKIMLGKKLEWYTKIINEIYEDKNEILLFFKKSETESEIFDINKIISFNEYKNNYYRFHEKISKFYENTSKIDYEDAIKNLTEFLSDDNNKEIIDNISQVFGLNIQYESIIKFSFEENNLLMKNIDSCLKNMNENILENITYFISKIILSLNEYARFNNKGMKNKNTFYKELNLNFGDLILYKQNEGNIITVPTFFSTSLKENLIEDNESSEEEIELRKKAGIFKVLITINYDCEECQIPTCIDITDFSKDKKIFLPFTCFIVKNVEIDLLNNISNIQLSSINKKIILEKYLNENNKIEYDDINENIEIKKIKNVLIHCIDERELNILNNISYFLEQQIDGNFLITNNEEYFHKILLQIKSENDNSKHKNTIKFELFLFEGSAETAIKYIKSNNYLQYFDNIIIMSGDKEKYSKEIFDNVIKDVFNKETEVINFIRNDCEGSLNSLKISGLITLDKYRNKYRKYHDVIAFYYKKISENYFETANEIFKDYIKSKNIELKEGKNKLIKCLYVFKKDYKTDLARYKKIIKVYTKEEGTFYKDFNYWLRNLEMVPIEKFGYFISQFMLSLNEYGKIKGEGLTGQHNLYRGLRLSFADLLLYEQNKGKIITFTSFTSTTEEKELALQFAEPKNDYFGVIMKIDYNVENNQIPLAIDINELNVYGEEERLILPFTFFKIEKVEINCSEKTGIIKMKLINKEKIIENELMESDILIYNRKKEIIEIEKNKIVIYNITDTINNTQIFGEKFVKNNKNKIDIKIENKIIPITSNYIFSEKGENIIEIIEKEPITNLSNMFCECSSITSINFLKNWDISNIIDTSFMFQNCKNITSINSLKNWNTSNIKNMYGMFKGCHSIISLDGLKNWDISNVENTSYMFYDCYSLSYIEGIKNWNMENVKEIDSMFYECLSLNSIYMLKNWKFKNLKNMSHLFKGCKNLKNINGLVDWNVSNVNFMTDVFCDCSSLINIEGLKNWNIKNVVDISGMFLNCISLKSIQSLENWNVNKVKDMRCLFCNCSSLISIKELNNWCVDNVKDMSNMFGDCTAICSIAELKNWKLNDYSRKKLMFNNCIGVKDLEELKNDNDDNAKKLYEIYYESNNNNNHPKILNLNNEQENIIQYKNNNTKIVFKTYNMKWNWTINIFGLDFVDQNKNKVMLKIDNNEIIPIYHQYLFKKENELTIEILEKENDEINSIKSMFQYCSQLKSIELINFNTDKITNNDASFMFYNCTSLLSIKINSILNLEKIKFANHMFSGCISLTNINFLKNFNMNNIQITNSMFANCFSLKSINGLENWKINNLLNATKMFSGCISLISIDALKNWNKKFYKNLDNNLYNTSYMFYKCYSLNSVNALLKWNMSNVLDTSFMFYDCKSLNNIDALKNWNIKKIQYCNYMFYNCIKINNISALKNWNMNDVISMEHMFENCFSLKNIDDLQVWNLNNIVDVDHMFCCCNNIKSVHCLKNWNMYKVDDMSYMFYGCNNVDSFESLKIWNKDKVKNTLFMFEKNVDI